MIDLKPACGRVIELLSGVADGQLTSPTPCAEYTVGDLIDHVDEVARGSTSVARKDVGEPGDGHPGDHRRAAVADHVRTLGEAWDDSAAWEGSTTAGDLELSNEQWAKIALTELVVHGWDLATATGQPFDLPDETLRACHDHAAEFVPNAPLPELCGPAVEVPADAPPPLLDQLLAITGRQP